MALTPEQVQLAAHGYALRKDEEDTRRWFCPSDDVFASAIRLWLAGWLDREWHGDDLVFRLSDAGMANQESLRAVAGREN